MSNYRRGADLERTVRQHLAEQGAWPIIRSAGSKGVIDLIASREGVTHAFQVKRECWPGPAERRALAAVTASTGWCCWSVRWEPRQALQFRLVDCDATLRRAAFGNVALCANP